MTTFSFSGDVARVVLDENQSNHANKGIAVSRGSVLIVEDEHLLGENLQEFLRRRGWQAQLARSGEDAVAAFERLRPCVVLMDYELPGMNGFETLGAIRARHSCCGCILMTAHPGEIVLTRAREHHISQVLYKPFALGDMEKWLRAETARCNCHSQPH